jgi:hypothetical protein
MHLVKVEGSVQLLASSNILGHQDFLCILFAHNKVAVGVCPALFQLAERPALGGVCCPHIHHRPLFGESVT